MSHRFADIAFTPAVARQQEQHGSREHYARLEARPDSNHVLGEREAAFLAQADSVYLGTVSETGWPYVQHRGGPRGFVKVLSPKQIGFADFRGNRQYVSAGNADGDDRVSIFVMDYANRQRLKLLGRLRFIDAAEADPALMRQLELPDYRAHIERAAVIDIVAFDWNCPQHITQRFTLEQVENAARPLRERVAQLEARLRAAGVSDG